MVNVSLVLGCEDEFFSNRFSRYVLEHNDFFTITSFTDKSFLIDYLKNNKVDVLLLNEDWISEEIFNYCNSSVVLCLGEENKEYEKYASINKYQKTDAIIKDITFRYAESVGDKSIVLSNNNSNCKTVCLYSPIGGSGKTTIALAIAGRLTMNGSRTVYLNFEKFSSECCFFNIDKVDGLSSLFLKLKNKNSNLSFEIMKNALADENGLKYLAPPDSAMEFNEMTKDEIIDFINEINMISEIDYLILDLPSEFDEKILDILKLSQNVVFVLTDDIIGTEKIRMFMKEINIFPELKLIYDKFLPVVNKIENGSVLQNISQLTGDKNILAAIPYINRIKRYSNVYEIVNELDRFIIEVIRNILK